MNSPKWPRQRRAKYTAQACVECKRRKVKCSGEVPCRRCISGGYPRCSYAPTGRPLPLREWKVSNQSSPAPPPAPLEDRLSRAYHESICDLSFSCSSNTPSARYFSSRLLTEQNIDILLASWFDELEYYYPIIDRSDFYESLDMLLTKHVTHEDGIPQVLSEVRLILLAALACMMLAMTTFIGGGAKHGHSSCTIPEAFSGDRAGEGHIHASRAWHAECRRLLNLCSYSESPNLHTLCIHVLEVIFMNMLQRKGDMSRAMAVTVDYAFAMNLNNEDAWTGCALREQEHRRLLWWTIYFLDRRIALLLKRPLLIRDADFIVAGFTDQSRRTFLSRTSLHLTTGSSDEQRPWKPPLPPTQDWYDYLEFNIRWSKIATRIWDAFFSLRGSRSIEVEQVELIDALLVKLQTGLPPRLRWDVKNLPGLLRQGTEDKHFRLQIVVFERINILHLVVRSRFLQVQHQLTTQQSKSQMVETAQDVAAKTIDSICQYLAVRDGIRSWSTYWSLSLVETCNWVTPILTAQTVPPGASYMVTMSVRRALECLEGMKKMKVAATEMAMERLTSVLNELAGPGSVAWTTALSLPEVCPEFWRDHRYTDDLGVGGDSWMLEQGLFDVDWEGGCSPSGFPNVTL